MWLADPNHRVLFQHSIAMPLEHLLKTLASGEVSNQNEEFYLPTMPSFSTMVWIQCENFDTVSTTKE